ncbi:MAG: secondary thiamine-phosphate synthase enzyme YjbQ [Pseudomonadota bacterium]|nr:secondary thiamine-phosphate synthase enzyme YjbQ [Pseudomonadota bacterium]
MLQKYEKINIKTYGINLYEITKNIIDWINQINLSRGLLNISIQHTSASLLLQENADPAVLEDLKNYFLKLVPFSDNYIHANEGYDDMPAHIKTSLTNTNITLSVIDKKLKLGKWQGIFLFEHRTSSKDRFINLHYIGD